MTPELQLVKSQLSATFLRMRLIEGRCFEQIKTLRDGRPILTMREVRERAEARQHRDSDT